MAEASDTQVLLYRNLIDAGCDHAAARRCVFLYQDRKTAEVLGLLTSHRKVLLDAFHRDRRRLDCLDYLIYKMEKEQRLEE